MADEEPSSSDNSSVAANICTDEITPAILSTSGTWLRLSMPYFPKKSVVWRYFDLYESDGYSRADTERIVKCRLMSCMRKELRLDAQSSTKGMWEHLRNKHPDEALKCENGAVAAQEEPVNVGALESATTATNQAASPSRKSPDVFSPYSAMIDDKKYETIHLLIGKLLESMQECQDRVHIRDQHTLLSFADYARLLTKAKTTTQFVCRDAPLVLPQPGTIVIYDTKDSGELDLGTIEVREHLREDGYTFDNNDSGLLPDNLYITRYFSGNADDFEEDRIMRYEVATTFEDAGYVLFHYVKSARFEVEPRGNTGDIPVYCYKPKASRLKKIDEGRRNGSNRGSPVSHLPVKIKRTEMDGLQAIAGCLPPSFQSLLGNIGVIGVDKEEDSDGTMDQSFEENTDGATGSGMDDSQIEDIYTNGSSLAGLLTACCPNNNSREMKQTLITHDIKSETKVEKRVMNILKKAVRDQRRTKVHYLARRTKNVNWVKVADQLQKKGIRVAATTAVDNSESVPAEDIMGQEVEHGELENCISDDADENDAEDNNDAADYDESASCSGQLLDSVDNNGDI